MKGIVAVALTIMALFGSSYGDEDMKKRILDFYKCVFCSDNDVLVEEFLKCGAMKPEKAKKILEDCKAEVFPGLAELKDRMKLYCDPETDKAEKMYTCLSSHPLRKEFDDDDRTKMKEFKKCAMTIGLKYCQRD